MVFPFSENRILLYRRKMKGDLAQKNWRKYDIFSKYSEKMVFPPKNRTGILFFLYYQEWWYLFFTKIWSYSLDGKWKRNFLKKIHGNVIFHANILKRWSFQKNCIGIWSFLYYQEKYYFFHENVILLFRLKTKGHFSQKNIQWNINVNNSH